MENGEAGVLLRDNQAYVALQPLDPDALRSRIAEDFRVKRWRSIVGRCILRERFAAAGRPNDSSCPGQLIVSRNRSPLVSGLCLFRRTSYRRRCQG